MTPGWIEALLRRRWHYTDRGRDYARRRVDCHGFTLGAAAEFFALDYPDPLYASSVDPTSTALAVELGRAGCTRIAREDARAGDLVLLPSGERWHTGLYGGDGRMLQLTAVGASCPALRGGVARRAEFYRGLA